MTLPSTKAGQYASAAGTASGPVVDVIVCTFNGADHIEEQLDSILDQSWPVRTSVFDDASTDDTVRLASKLLRSEHDRLHINSCNVGHVRNFQQSIEAVLSEGAQYVALSDQDDRWATDRIASGMLEIKRLERIHGLDMPILVHSDLRVMDNDGRILHQSYLKFRQYRLGPKKSLSLIAGENGVMGNTILMNRALARLSIPFPEGLHVHDYWLGLLAELYGVRVMIEEAKVDYRLHGSNASNTANALLSGVRGQCNMASLRRWLRLDLKLPFKEDSRLLVLDFLLRGGARLPRLKDQDRKVLQPFVDYLRFEQYRWLSLSFLLTSGVVRRGLAYRLRLCVATIFTVRYSR